MTRAIPILYLVDASVAVTGAFMAARHAAQLLAGDARIVLVLPRGSTIPETELRDFWRVDYVPMVTPSKRLSALLGYFPALFIGSWQLKQRMRRDGAAHLLLNDFYLLHGTVVRLLGYRGRIVSWIRGDPRRFAGFLAAPMLRLARRCADRMVAVSAYVTSLLPPGISADILYDCYTGQPRTPKQWNAADEKIFVYVGNYIQGKGQDVALRAFATIAAQDTTLQLHFYGGDMGLEKNRDYRSMLTSMVQQYGLAGRVMFGGFLTDTSPVLASAYAALNCSVSESFSMTALEASGAGLPVIATACGGPEEILVDGASGYLIPIDDADAAAARMLQLAQDPIRAATMGEAGAAHIRARFSPPAFREQLLQLLAIDPVV